MKTYKLGMKVIKYSSIILFIMYVSYLIYLTFFDRFFGRGTFHRKLVVIPFETTLKILTAPNNWRAVVINIFGNIAAFIPMGFLLPFVFTRLNGFFRIFTAVLFATLSIEVLQYVTGAGITDIDDVIFNVLGGLCGFILAQGMIKLFTCLGYNK